MQGINTIDGKVTFKGVAEGLNLPYYDIRNLKKAKAWFFFTQALF